MSASSPYQGSEIAIIAMACRFPGANTPESFWHNLSHGIDSVSTLTDTQLAANGVSAAEYQRADYVRQVATIDNVENFDADIFSMSAREAALMDPQQRIFLECIWEALERACYQTDNYPEPIGLFAGSGLAHYFYRHVLADTDPNNLSAMYQALLLNDKDYLCTRSAYQFGLTGPAMTVQTACSSSLVAVHMACQSLLAGESDIALAGGVSIQIPHHRGFRFQEGMILSPEGQCRAFDASANGTVLGSGAGVVVLRRLEEAQAAGDTICAVIRGTAVNNDGHHKMGFTAPSVQGQTAVIREAQAVAAINADEIQYIEAHGTGTPLGDPIEIQALTRAFSETNQTHHSCLIGSVKSNIGHLDAAAGIAGLIKVVLSLQHQQIPASLHFEQPNPKIAFENTPFEVCAKQQAWPNSHHPACAAVSAFGMGGTNAHAIVAKAPEPLARKQPNRDTQLILLSAATELALEQRTTQLAQHLQNQTPHSHLLADAAFSLAIGRKALPLRRIIVTSSIDDTLKQLNDISSLTIQRTSESSLPIVFLFPGQGAQYPGMATALYATEQIFKDKIDKCLDLIPSETARQLKPLLIDSKQPAAQLNQTAFSQPAIFIVEYALASLWKAWGITPSAMIGHSVGEYAAACIAGVFSLPDALHMVCKRGQLVQTMPPGSMLAASLSEQDARHYLQPGIEIAAINSAKLMVFSGTHTHIEALQKQLTNQGKISQLLHTSHAFHCALMDPMLADFHNIVSSIDKQAPNIPIMSSLTGGWLSKEQAISNEYWNQHLRHTVQFHKALSTLLTHQKESIFLEVGPNQSLTQLAKSHANCQSHNVFPSLPRPDGENANSTLLNTLGQLWMNGATVQWQQVFDDKGYRRMTLPTYPFQRKRYWIEENTQTVKTNNNQQGLASRLPPRLPLRQWFYRRTWQRITLPLQTDLTGKKYLVFTDNENIAWKTALGDQCQNFVAVSLDKLFKEISPHDYCIDRYNLNSIEQLFNSLAAKAWIPDHVIYAWPITCRKMNQALEIALPGLIILLKNLANQAQSIKLSVIASGTQSVLENESLNPALASLMGPILVAPQEYQQLHCQLIDITLEDLENQIPLIVKSLAYLDNILALRGSSAWKTGWQPESLDTHQSFSLPQQGAYLITGGLGRIGLSIARYLSDHSPCHLILTTRQTLPAREHWSAIINDSAKTHPQRDVIVSLQDLEKRGTSVWVATVDVANASDMAELFNAMLAKFQRLTGVFHCAGELKSARCPLIASKLDTYQAQLQTKLQGTLVLSQLLNDHPVDFVVCMSSLAAILGGYEMSAYAAANNAMDLVVASQANNTQSRWITLNWDAWQFDQTSDDESIQNSQLAHHAISADEGMTALTHALASPSNQLAIATHSLTERINQWHKKPSVVNNKQQPHQRPKSSTPYVSPSSETEHQLCAIWTELLAIHPVSIHDNFFELGGHSLMATQALSRIRDTFQLTIPLKNFFETPTVAGIAATINDYTMVKNLTKQLTHDTDERIEIEV